jgi:ribosome-associated translation inhibitor RaiA
VQTKPLSELSVDGVIHLLESLNLRNYYDYTQAIEQDVIDVDTIEALKIEIDRLKVFKPTNSNILLSIEQFRNKIELFIQTNDVPRAKVLATNRDINGLRAFKEVIAELKKQVDELSSKRNSFIREVGRSLYLLY